jgi:hypothetical protein
MEDFATAVHLYEELAKSGGSIDHEAEDIMSNYYAARAQHAWLTGMGTGKEIRNTLDSYEVCFNGAYELAGLSQLAEAEELLNRAQSTCRYTNLV